MALLTDAVCAALLSAAVVLTAAAVLHAGVGWAECVLLAFAGTALAVLITRRWWITPVFALCAALLAWLAAALLSATDALLASLGRFADVFMGSTGAARPGILAGMLLALPVCLLSLGYFRRFFRFPPLLAAGAAMVVCVFISDAGDVWPVLFIALFLAFAGAAKKRGGRLSRGEGIDSAQSVNSAMLTLCALIVMPVVLLLALVMLPANDSDWQSRPLINAVQDIGDLLSGEARGEGQYGFFTFGEGGLPSVEQRLGGDVTVNNEPVLWAVTDTPVRLTGAVYDTYDGGRWTDARQSRRFRLSGELWQGGRAAAFDWNKPAGGEQAQALYERLTKTALFRIICRFEGRTVYSAGRALAFDSETFDVSDIFFNEQSELFTSSTTKPLKYMLYTTVVDRDAPNFDRNMRALETLTARIDDPQWESVKAAYTQLPDTLEPSVYETARQAVAGCETAYEKAGALEKWLAEHCRYTLTPGPTVQGGDFVSGFLRARQGYCVHFASAMTVMARCAGLPARFVTGYALQRYPGEESDDVYVTYVATAATAHAWTEVYFKGIGWVTFDATGWNFDDYAEVADIQETEETQTTLTSAPPGPDGAEQAASGGARWPLGAWLALAAVPAALLLFIALRGLTLSAGAKRRYARLCHRYASAADRLDACFAEAVRQLNCLGVVRRPIDTVSSLSRRADERLGGSEMSEACAPVAALRYGQQPPDGADVLRLCAFCAALEKRLRRELRFGRYVLRRVLMIGRTSGKTRDAGFVGDGGSNA